MECVNFDCCLQSAILAFNGIAEQVLSNLRYDRKAVTHCYTPGLWSRSLSIRSIVREKLSDWVRYYRVSIACSDVTVFLTMFDLTEIYNSGEPGGPQNWSLLNAQVEYLKNERVGFVSEQSVQKAIISHEELVRIFHHYRWDRDMDVIDPNSNTARAIKDFIESYPKSSKPKRRRQKM